MGCTGKDELKENEENFKLDEIKLDEIPVSQKLNKSTKIDLLENKNKNQFIMNCTEFYKNQVPEKNNDNIYIDKLYPSQIFTPEVEELLQIENSNIVWKSAREIFGKKVKIFGETISYKDIKMGPANNSYFVSAISSMSEFSNIVTQLFRTFSFPENGDPIEVCIRIEGKWTVICLDDKFMVNKENNIPIFSTSPTNNIWGLLLEKAWAKVCGGYENIIYGNSKEIFEAFTNFRIIEINLKKIENEAFWEYINSTFEHNCIMTCTTKNDLFDYESIGFFSNFYFSLFENKDNKKNKDNNLIKFVKIRNPIGDSDMYTNIINEELIQKIGILNSEENGIILMDYTKFMKYFSLITICVPTSILKSYLIKIPSEKANDFGTIRILIEEETNLCISIISLSCRFHENITPENDIPKNIILIQLFRNKQKANYISSSFNESLFTKVQPGEYIYIYNVDYKIAEIKEIKPFNINITSSKPIKYCLDEPDNNLELLKMVMIPKIEKLKKYEKLLKNDFIVFTGNKFELTSFGFYYMKNRKEELKYVKPLVFLRNFKSIEGDFPIALKMSKNSVFFFLFNRIKSKSAYQTGANVGFFKKEVEEAVEPKSFQQLPEKYCKEVSFENQKWDYEFDVT